jgi:hypothetical protein
MDIENKTNKAMSAEDAKNKSADTPTTAIAANKLENDYFFPGGGVWKPMTVRAPSREQAEEIHRETPRSGESG